MIIHSSIGRISGSVEIFLVRNGKQIPIAKKKNTVLLQGMDLISRALAGAMHINGVYFLYDNAGGGSYPTPLDTYDAEYYQTVGSTGPLGFVRGPVVASPTFEYANGVGKSWYTAVSVPNVAVPSGVNELTDGVSDFYGAALGYLDPSDIAADKLMSAVSFTDVTTLLNGVIQKIAGASLGIRWCLTAETV